MTELVPPELYAPSGRIPPAKKKIAKERFLRFLGESHSIYKSAKHAGITPKTAYKWMHDGVITPDELAEANKCYEDKVRGLLDDRISHGTQKPLVIAGRIQHDDDGKEIWLDNPSDDLLYKVAKHILPEFKEVSKSEITITQYGIPEQFLLALDARDLTSLEFQEIKRIIENIEARKSGVTIVDSDTFFQEDTTQVIPQIAGRSVENAGIFPK